MRPDERGLPGTPNTGSPVSEKNSSRKLAEQALSCVVLCVLHADRLHRTSFMDANQCL